VGFFYAHMNALSPSVFGSWLISQDVLRDFICALHHFISPDDAVSGPASIGTACGGLLPVGTGLLQSMIVPSCSA
jgi:hypothetical protein